MCLSIYRQNIPHEVFLGMWSLLFAKFKRKFVIHACNSVFLAYRIWSLLFTRVVSPRRLALGEHYFFFLNI
jgi:hypothetical protein